jgi:hypothetical protein
MYRKYGKTIFAFFYAVAVVAVPLASGDHHIDQAEGVQIAIAVCANGIVWLVPLVPSAPWTKTALGAALAGLNVVAAVIVGGINGNEWVSVAAAVLGALGITLAPAISPKTQTASGAGTSLR